MYYSFDKKSQVSISMILGKLSEPFPSENLATFSQFTQMFSLL